MSACVHFSLLSSWLSAQSRGFLSTPECFVSPWGGSTWPLVASCDRKSTCQLWALANNPDTWTVYFFFSFLPSHKSLTCGNVMFSHCWLLPPHGVEDRELRCHRPRKASVPRGWNLSPPRRMTEPVHRALHTGVLSVTAGPLFFIQWVLKWGQTAEDSLLFKSL